MKPTLMTINLTYVDTKAAFHTTMKRELHLSRLVRRELGCHYCCG
ncbi:hypothetical protein [Hymenobacter negativus]|nr:hypothetical protein [Hymenobacter negativus]